MKNFLRLDGRSILSVPYMYIDHKDYLADSCSHRTMFPCGSEVNSHGTIPVPHHYLQSQKERYGGI